jgi:hypothetical protein
VPTSVPLQLSAVIEGSGTRADATEKTQFVKGDQITITKVGDTKTTYIYEYDGKDWAPIDSDNAIELTKDDATFTARYSEDEEVIGTLSTLDAKCNDLVSSEVKANLNSYKVKFVFTHESCELQINLIHFDATEASFGQYIVDIWADGAPIASGSDDITGSTIKAYVPKTATKAEVTLGEKTYKFTLSNLEAGKTYVCNICTNFIEAKNCAMYDVYLGDETYARVSNGDDIDATKVTALKAYAKSKGTNVWGVVLYNEDYGMEFYIKIAALKDYVDSNGDNKFTISQGHRNGGPEDFETILTDSKLQNIIKAFDGDLLATDSCPYYWTGTGGGDSNGAFAIYFDASNGAEVKLYEKDDNYNTFLARAREFKELIIFDFDF